MSNVVFKKRVIWLDRINGKRIMTPEERKERQREIARNYYKRHKKEQLALLEADKGVPVVPPKVSID